jgi:glucose/arabinose dehydrogenase
MTHHVLPTPATKRVAAIGLALLMAGCAPRVIEPATPSVPQAPQLQLPAGFTASVFAFGLNGPTALAFGPDPDPLTGQGSRLYVAQLNGGENAGTGQVIAIDSAGAKPQVIVDTLMKPTGLAWFNDALYVVAYRDVLKFSVVNDKLGEPQILAKDVPFNGRSLGHIKAGPSPDPFTGENDSRLYFSSSGGVAGASGFIYAMKLDGNDQRIVARGLKNGYAFAWALTDGTMYATEIGDAALPPPEEINVIRRDADYGWPACDATQTCAGVQNPIATFPAHSTPTGIAWWENSLIVALFGPADPYVARIALDENGQPEATTDFIRGMSNPIDVIVTSQGHLLALDFAGMIWEIKKF